MPEHIMEKKIYYAVFGALMVLLAATVLIAYIHLGKLNFIAAVSIAVVKAVLIILYFMHVRYSSRLLWIFVGAGFFWLGILFALSFSDYLTRGWLPLPTGWERARPYQSMRLAAVVTIMPFCQLSSTRDRDSSIKLMYLTSFCPCITGT